MDDQDYKRGFGTNPSENNNLLLNSLEGRLSECENFDEEMVFFYLNLLNEKIQSNSPQEVINDIIIKIQELVTKKFKPININQELLQNIANLLCNFTHNTNEDIVLIALRVARILTREKNFFEPYFLAISSILDDFKGAIYSNNEDIVNNALCIFANLFDFDSDFGIAFINEYKIDSFINLYDKFCDSIYSPFSRIFFLFSTKIFDPILIQDLSNRIDLIFNAPGKQIPISIIILLSFLLFRCSQDFKFFEKFMRDFDENRLQKIQEQLVSQIMQLIVEKHDDFWILSLIRLINLWIHESTVISRDIVSKEYIDLLVDNANLYSFDIKVEIINLISTIIIYKDFNFIFTLVSNGILDVFLDWLDYEHSLVINPVLMCFTKICDEFSSSGNSGTLSSSISPEFVDKIYELRYLEDKSISRCTAIAHSALMSVLDEKRKKEIKENYD